MGLSCDVIVFSLLPEMTKSKYKKKTSAVMDTPS